MARRYSREELLERTSKYDARRDAIYNPNTNFETFKNTLSVAATGGLESVSNVFANLLDLGLEGETADIITNAKALRKKVYGKTTVPLFDFEFQMPRALDMALDVGKLPFQDADPDIENPIEKMRKASLFQKKKLEEKSKLGAQYAGGGFGSFAGEIVKALPILKFGTMSRTNQAIKSGNDITDVARAVSIDTIRNIGSMGASEVALSKFYGESDKEAVEKGIFAAATGGAGTPLIGGAKLLGNKIIKSTTLSNEEMAKMAGGGTPSEKQIAELDRKQMKNVKVDVGEKLPKQKEVETTEVKKFDLSFDDERGRNYSDSWLNNYQGKPTDKASTTRLPEGDIKNVDEYVNSMKRSFKSHLDTIETYGSADTKFKSKGFLTKAEKLKVEKEFEKDLMFRLSKDKRLSLSDKRIARKKGKKLHGALKDMKGFFPEELSAKTEISYSSQNVAYETPIKHNAEATKRFDIWRKDNEGFDKGTYTGFEREFATKSDADKVRLLSSAVQSKIKDKDFVEAVDSISTSMKLKVETFDINNITSKNKNDFPNETKVITEYVERKNDLELLENSSISPREFSFRESKRIDQHFKKENIIDGEFESRDALKKAINDKEKAYLDIGLRRKPEVISIKKEPVGDVKPDIIDKTDYKKLDFQRAIKKKAMNAYRKDKTINRYQSGDRIGESVLTDAQIRDLDEFGDILKNKDILDKTIPRVSDIDKVSATKTARERAKNKVKSGQYKKSGINFSMLKPMIKFDQTILDVKNSMGQIAAILIGSERFAKQVFVDGESKEFRELLAERMSDKLGINITKKEVKTPVMITGYGSMKKGTTRVVMDENTWIKTEQQANEFMDVFYEEFDKLAPELSELMDKLRTIHSGRPSDKAVYKWTMPDGYKVEFDLRKYQDYVIKDSKGKQIGIAKVRTESIDRMSRALLPNIFHSIDGYIAREMRDRMNIQTTHDAWHVPKGREAEAELVYRDILKELNNINLMGDIFESIGLKGWKKSGKLSDDMFSLGRLLEAEHKAGEVEFAKASKQTPTKQMTESEVMREFMTQSSHRNHQHFKMIDAMVDESVQSKHSLAIARSTDDVYERALAYAFQGNQFGKTKMIPPPKDTTINVDAWYAEQSRIFKEFRAKLEFNPDLADSIKGTRKSFTKNGEVIGSTVRSQRQIREKVLVELKREEAILKSKGSDIEISSQKQLHKDNAKTIKKAKAGKANEVTEYDIDKLVIEEKSKQKLIDDMVSGEVPDNLIPNRLTPDEARALDTAEPFGWKDKFNKLVPDAMHHITEKYKDTKAYRQYQKFLGTTKNTQKDAEQSGDSLKKYIDDLLNGENQDEWTKKLFETDARVLRDFKDRGEAGKFWDDNIDLYHGAKSAIEQSAKAIGKEEHQIGAFLNNAKAIAEKYDIPSSRIDDLDKMISIRAMKQNDAWDFFEMHHGTERFNSLMDIAESQFQRSSTHFKHEKSLNKQVKGYLAEYYDGGKQITPDGKIIWDAESKYEVGATGIDMTKNKVGKFDETKIDENMFESESQMIDFAKKNNLKITDKGWRKIPTGETKDKAGRRNNLAQRLGATEASIEGKTAQYNSIVKILSDDGAYNELFSKVAKTGFTKVTKEQLDKMPFLMKDEVKFVNSEYYEKMLGRDEIRLIRKNATQVEKVADRLLSNLVTLFKQAVVLKNPSSYKSALIVNFSTNLLIDPNIIRATRNAKKSFDIFSKYSEIVRKHDIARAKGETETYKVYDYKTKTNVTQTRTKYSGELADNEVQKYLDLGMSINTLDGVRGQSSMLSYMASDISGNRFDKIGNEILMNQRGTTGNITKNVFSYIDFQGRYMAIKSLEKNGIKPADAVRRANDLFGQMDDMAPALIHGIDKYGALVFAKWLASVAPAVAKASRNNPKKAFALTVGLYYLSDATDIMFSNISPVEGTLDMAVSGATGDGWVWNEKFATSIIPGIYRDLWKQSAYAIDDTQHWHEGPAILWKNRLEPWTTKNGEFIDHRGITQKSLDFAFKNGDD